MKKTYLILISIFVGIGIAFSISVFGLSIPKLPIFYIDGTTAKPRSALDFNFLAGDITTTGNIGIGNTDLDTPLEIATQNAINNFAFTLSDGDVDHGMTAIAPTDVYGAFQLNHGTKGGLEIIGLEDAANSSALTLTGYMGSTDPSDSVPAVIFRAGKQSGITRADLGALETAFQFQDGTDDPMITILGNGNVGIGTITPSEALDLGSGDFTTEGRIIATGGGQTGKFLTGLAGYTVLAFDGANFDIRAGAGNTAAQNVMRVDNSGNFDFYDGNLTTTGNITAASSTLSGNLDVTGTITQDAYVTINDGVTATYFSIYGGGFGINSDGEGTFDAVHSSTWKDGSGTNTLMSWDASEIDVEQDLSLQADNRKIQFGTGKDASIYYDGNYLVFSSQEVGTGDFYFTDGDIVMENAEKITNAVNGQIHIEGSGGTYDSQRLIIGLDSNYYVDLSAYNVTDSAASTLRFVGAVMVGDNKDFIYGDASDVRMRWTTQGNDHLVIGIPLGSAAQSGNFLITERAGWNDDYTHGIASNPTFIIHSATRAATSTDEWISFSHDKTDAVIESGTGSISFVNDNLITTGNITAASSTLSGNLNATGTITAEQLTSTDDITMAGYFYNAMGVGDDIGVYNYQPNYTGASTLYGLKNYVKHSGASGSSGRGVKGMYNQVLNDHIVTGSPIGVTQETMGMHNYASPWNAEHTATASFGGFLEITRGMYNEVVDASGRVLSQTATGNNIVSYEGIRNKVYIETSAEYDNGAGSVTVNAYGTYSEVTNKFQETAGTVTANTYGDYVTVTGNASGDSTAYGLYVASVSGADDNYGIWDASGANWILDANDQKIIFGEGQDASIYYDNTNLIIDPREVGSGGVGITSFLDLTEISEPTTPAANHAKIYLNSSTNDLEIRWDSGATSTIVAHP